MTLGSSGTASLPVEPPLQNSSLSDQSAPHHWNVFDWLPWSRSPPPPPPSLPPLTPEAAIFYDMLSDLKEAIEADGGHINDVAFTVPVWLTDAQAIHLFLAAEKANLSVHYVGLSPAAVAASHGVDLCQTPSDYLLCDVERLMTLNLNNSTLTATAQYISRNSYILHHNNYSVKQVSQSRRGNERTDWSEVTEWINDFARGKGITRLYLLWPAATDLELRQALRNSDLAPVLHETSERSIALGTAAIAKEILESQEYDCIEDAKCELIREKADQLAGRPPWRDQLPRSEL